MEFDHLLNLVGDEPVFESALLLAGDINPKVVRLQLTRWDKNGRIYQLRRGLYVLAPPYQKQCPILLSLPTSCNGLPISACNQRWPSRD